MKLQALFKRASFLLIALVGLAALTACQSEPEYYGTMWPSPQDISDFTLTSSTGPVSLSDFEGEVVLLYFGYTYCPDICPGTMNDLGQVATRLKSEGHDVQVIMVTVDPERDTADRMAEYVQHFHPSFIGLTGNKAEITAVAEEYGVFFEAHEGTEASGYLVDHTSRVFVVDTNGQYWLSFPFGMPPEEMESDLRNVLRQG